MNNSGMEIFENESETKALLKLALPTVLGQIMIVLYNMADTFFIGQTNDNVKITAVTMCMPAFMFLSAIANLFGIGGSSVISRALGKSNRNRAKYACAFGFWGCIALTVLYSVSVYLFINPFINFLGGSNPDVHMLASEYIVCTVVVGGLFTSLASFMSHIVRSEGKSVHASAGVLLGGFLNIVLDPLFMFVIMEPGNEVLGAAFATAISNFISFIYYVIVSVCVSKKGSIVYFGLSKHSFEWEIPKKVLESGIPACVMTLAENISYSFLDNLLSAYGTAVQAGIGIAKKINMLAHSIVRGITQGALPLLGYNYSAGKRIKTKKIVLSTVSFSLIASLACTLGMFVFSHSLIRIFIMEGNESMKYGIVFIKILCLGGPFSAIAYTFISFFQAVGHGGVSFILALLRKGLLDIPMMFVLRYFASLYGIVMATPITDLVCCLVSLLLFAQFASKHLNNNKKRKVFNPITGTYDIVLNDKSLTEVDK